MLRFNLNRLQFWRDNDLILREIRYFPYVACIAVIAPIFAAIFEGLGVGSLTGFLQNLVDGSEPFRLGITWFDIHVLGIHESEFNRLYRISTLILLLAVLRAIFNYLSWLYLEIAKIRLVERLYKRIFEQLQALSLSFFDNSRSGETLNTLTNEVSELQMAINSIGFIVIKSTVLLMYVIVALTISWQLCIMAVMLFGLAAAGLSKLNVKVRAASIPLTIARGRFTSKAAELMDGIRTIQTFGSQDFERQRYYCAIDEVVERTTYASKRMTIVRPLAEIIATSILIFIIIVGMTLFVANDVLNIAELLTFLFILFRLVPAMRELNGDFAQLSRYKGSIQNIKGLLTPDGKPYLKYGSKPFQGLSDSIQLVNVNFAYEPDILVLHQVNLTIPKGQTVALVGASGSGKSTLADLIIRLYDLSSGTILIDGEDYRNLDIHDLRKRMAVVSQDTFIFNATVRENIAYGLESVADEDIVRAAELSNAADFIRTLPEGFNTSLGDRGVRLSGGQRQRIAIARAILRNPDILILDEATSALDSVSEHLIQASLEQLSVGRTVITIAHRLSTIIKADNVVVLEGGTVVEQGPYAELIERRGKLWKYHQLQAVQ